MPNNVSFTSIKASQLGCVMDCVLSTGLTAAGAAPTDNTAVINAYLANASLTNPLELILDGGTACKGIVIPQGSHVSIRGTGLDSGFYILTGSNAHILTNGVNIPFTFSGLTQPTPSGSVVLQDFYINGNRGNGTTGDSTSGNPRGINGEIWYCGIDLVNVASFTIDGVSVYDAPTYGIRLTNCTWGTISNVQVNNPAGQDNTDTIHINGGCNNITITGCVLDNLQSDDGIALNGPEGYPNGNTGIYNIAVAGCVLTTNSLFRLYGCYDGSNVPIYNITAADCTITCGYGLLLGANASGTKDQDIITRVNISNCQFIGCQYGLVNVSDPVGDFVMDDCTWMSPSVANVPWLNFSSPTPAVTISHFQLNNCHVYRDTNGNQAGPLVTSNVAGSTITKLSINNFSAINEANSPAYSPIADLLVMTDLAIGELEIGGINPDLITALTASFTGITTIRGAGVLATGYAIPDSVMANNVPYISATTNQPTIKIGGTAQPLGGPVIANIQIAMPTTAIAANSATSVTTVSMPGLALTSAIIANFATDPAAVVGWGTSGGLVFVAYPSAANTLAWLVINQTAVSITPGAITMNVGAK